MPILPTLCILGKLEQICEKFINVNMTDVNGQF